VACEPTAPISTIAVVPVEAHVPVGSTQRFVAVVRDTDGRRLTDWKARWTSTEPTVAMVDDSGFATAQAAGATMIVAELGGFVDSATLRVGPGRAAGPKPWPHEPDGFVTIEETGWESRTLGPWLPIFPSADKPITIEPVPDSPIGESWALQIGYHAGHAGGGGTELRFEIPEDFQRPEIFVGFYVQVNSAWQGHSSAINKILYLHDGADSFSAMWYEMFGAGGDALGLYVVNQSGSGPEGVHENVKPVAFRRGEWQRVEIYQQQGQENDGIVRVWVDDTLAIDRSDIDTGGGWVDNVTLSGIWGGVGDAKRQVDYMRFDRIRISVK
jgi:hypothetical protein